MKRFPKYFKQIIAVAAVTGGLFATSPVLAQVDNALVLRVPIELNQIPNIVTSVELACTIDAKLSEAAVNLPHRANADVQLGMPGKYDTPNGPQLIIIERVPIDNRYGALSKIHETRFPTKYFDLIDLHENGSYRCFLSAMRNSNSDSVWSFSDLADKTVIKSFNNVVSGKIIPDNIPASSTFSGMELNQSLNENKLNRNIKLK